MLKNRRHVASTYVEMTFCVCSVLDVEMVKKNFDYDNWPQYK